MSTEYEPVISVGFKLDRKELINKLLIGVDYRKKDEDEILEEIVQERLGLNKIINTDRESFYSIKIKPISTINLQYIKYDDLNNLKEEIEQKKDLLREYQINYDGPFVSSSIFSY